jgi:hypothetical protein
MVFEPEKFFFDSLPARNVEGTTYCLRCKCDIKDGEWSSHDNEEIHASRTAALEKVKVSERKLHMRRKEAITWKFRISSLNRAHSRNELYRNVVDYVTDCSMESTTVTVPLEKYECMERVDLLHLAVWKGMCILSPPPNIVFRSVVECQAWLRTGWKILKAEMRESNAMAIIHAHVMPWLE